MVALSPRAAFSNRDSMEEFYCNTYLKECEIMESKQPYEYKYKPHKSCTRVWTCPVVKPVNPAISPCTEFWASYLNNYLKNSILRAQFHIKGICRHWPNHKQWIQVSRDHFIFLISEILLDFFVEQRSYIGQLNISRVIRLTQIYL